jgi:hypothetical protein
MTKNDILLLVLGIEAGILVGFAYAEARRWIREGRHMVLHAVNSLRSPIA